MIILSEEIDDIMKIVKSIEESDLMIKGVLSIKNEAKEQKDGLIGIILGTIATRLLGNMFEDKPKILERGVTRAVEGVI